jgi:hypothetical protein
VKLLRRLVVGLLLFIGLNIYGLEEEKKWVEQALGSWNLGLLEEAVDALDTQAKSSPQDVKLAYWQSVAAFHLLLMTENPSNEQIEPTLETVKRAYQLNKNHPEINAMLCVLYGMRIKEKQVRSVWLGPRLMSHSKKALAIARRPSGPLPWWRPVGTYSGQEKKGSRRSLALAHPRGNVVRPQKAKSTPTKTAPRWGSRRAMCQI